MTARFGRARPAFSAAAILLLLACSAAATLSVLPIVVADTASPLSGGITGPSTVGTGLNATYQVTAHGGPAEAPNGTQIGVYSYKASLTATNTTGAAILPTQGVLVNGTVSLTLKAPKAVESLTLYVLVTSTLDQKNVSQNFSYTVSVVQPYVVTANLLVGGGASVSPFGLTVSLDGAPVGEIRVPGLSAGATYPVSFSYVPGSLPAGWHTFSLSLAQEHGLVAFAGGADVYTTSFYVAGPPASNTIWYLTGASAFLGAIFIWSTRVAARRRGRTKK